MCGGYPQIWRIRPREHADSEASRPRHRSERTTETTDNPVEKPEDQIEEMWRAIDALHGMLVVPDPVDRLVKVAELTDDGSSTV